VQHEKTCGLSFRKSFLVLFALLVFSGGIYAQEASTGYVPFWALDAGIMTNDALIEGISFGLVVDPRLSVSSRLMVGSKNVINLSTDNLLVLESQAYARWNFFRFGSKRINNVFLQGGIGLLAAYRGSEATQTRGSVLADATLGINIPVSDRWHIEPSIRAGYPFIIGAGLTAGIRFPMRRQQTEIVRGMEPGRVIREIPPEEIIRRVIITQVEYILFGPEIATYNDGIDADGRALNGLVLDVVAKTLIENPDLIVRIEGHANPVTLASGEAEELMLLSEQRSNEVARLLRERGVADSQIMVIAHGGSMLLSVSHNQRNLNRRVELIIKHIDAD